MLTVEIIAAARNNDIEATAAVIEATETRVVALAGKFARRLSPIAGTTQAQWREELAQVGRVAVWDGLKRQSESDVDKFFAFMYRTVEGAIRDHVRAQQSAGIDGDAVKVFASVMEAANGDAYEAEKLAQTLPPKGRRLSADRARAARLAWQGALSIDAPTADVSMRTSGGMGNDTSSLAHTLAAPTDETHEVRPKVGHGAALEALSVLERYAGVVVQRMTPREFAANLPTLVDVLEDTVVVPREPQTRRYVLDALCILRSAVSTSVDGDLADDLRNASDALRDARAVTVTNVRAVLDDMGEAQREVLRHTFGIDGGMAFGWGDSGDLEGLAAYLGVSPVMANNRRVKARQTFAKRYVERLRSLGATALAASLEEGAAAALARGGRK